MRSKVCFIMMLSTWISMSNVHAGLVAHWPLNEGSGDEFKDLAGDNDGFLAEDSEVEWVKDGPEGIQDTSVLFIGDEGGPSYIETTFEGIGGADARTITLWVKAAPQHTNTAMVSYGSLANGRKWHFRINQGTNSLRTEYQGGQNFATTDLADEEWHFVASVFPEGAEFGAEILHFLDGEFDDFAGGNDREIDTGVGPDDDAFPVHIGTAIGHPDRYFAGQIADVRIYDEELSEAALLDIMNGGGNQGVAGDYDADGELTAADIDALTSAIVGGASDAIYDLNNDGSVTSADRRAWIVDLKNTWIGDANLDGEFNSSDFVAVFQAGEYEDTVAENSTWATGDWNGDKEFSSSDFVVAFQDGGFELGPRAAVSSVPEPTGLGAILLFLGLFASRIRRIKR